mmetsp:Transcript_7497/g.21331  ORF Transcript_7497/g.21331 Transcript_7497/m.21331 type:complete len:236 (-) Transcript_7497:171-878(-)
MCSRSRACRGSTLAKAHKASTIWAGSRPATSVMMRYCRSVSVSAAGRWCSLTKEVRQRTASPTPSSPARRALCSRASASEQPSRSPRAASPSSTCTRSGASNAANPAGNASRPARALASPFRRKSLSPPLARRTRSLSWHTHSTEARGLRAPRNCSRRCSSTSWLGALRTKAAMAASPGCASPTSSHTCPSRASSSTIRRVSRGGAASASPTALSSTSSTNSSGSSQPRDANPQR